MSCISKAFEETDDARRSARRSLIRSAHLHQSAQLVSSCDTKHFSLTARHCAPWTSHDVNSQRQPLIPGACCCLFRAQLEFLVFAAPKAAGLQCRDAALAHGHAHLRTALRAVHNIKHELHLFGGCESSLRHRARPAALCTLALAWIASVHR